MSNSTGQISELDWNFDAVPKDELVACCYWEYARESVFIRNTLKKYREWYLAGGKRSDEALEIGRHLERIQTLSYASEVFVRGCAFPPERVCQSFDPAKPNFRHPQAPVLTGSFPAPWQSLMDDEREERSRIRSDRTAIPLVPIKRGDRHDAADIAKWAEGRWYLLHEEFEKVRRENPETSEVDLIAQGKLKPLPGIQPSLYWEGGSEVTVLNINWAEFTNEEIIRYFREWVKKNRPQQSQNPDSRGRKPKDWRANLTRLAVMRLLSRYKALEMVDDRKKKFADIWKTKQFSGAKWADVNKWYDARREAEKFFIKIFPFLPPDEKPLSRERMNSVE